MLTGFRKYVISWFCKMYKILKTSWTHNKVCFSDSLWRMPKWSDGGSHIGGTLTKKSYCHNVQPHLKAEVASFSNQSGLFYEPIWSILSSKGTSFDYNWTSTSGFPCSRSVSPTDLLKKGAVALVVVYTESTVLQCRYLMAHTAFKANQAFSNRFLTVCGSNFFFVLSMKSRSRYVVANKLTRILCWTNVM